MEHGPGPDDELGWAPPSPPQPQRPAGPPEPPGPTGPAGGVGRPAETGRIDRGGAAVTAGLFGALAGVTLPLPLFWVTFSLLRTLGAPDVLTAFGALAVALGVPLVLFRQGHGPARTLDPPLRRGQGRPSPSPPRSPWGCGCWGPRCRPW